MNTVEVVLFLVPDGCVSIIFATGQCPWGEMAMDLTRPAVQKYFSNPDQHSHSLHGYFSPEGQDFKRTVFRPGVRVRI